MENLIFNISESGSTVIECTASLCGLNVCECRLSVHEGIWNISSWFTKDGYGGCGIGKKTMHKLFSYTYEKYGKPEKVHYTWNGANKYVMDWLERNFDAFCTCPIAVQKLATEDDWSAHIYELNTEKILNYFCI